MSTSRITSPGSRRASAPVNVDDVGDTSHTFGTPDQNSDEEKGQEFYADLATAKAQRQRAQQVEMEAELAQTSATIKALQEPRWVADKETMMSMSPAKLRLKDDLMVLRRALERIQYGIPEPLRGLEANLQPALTEVNMCLTGAIEYLNKNERNAALAMRHAVKAAHQLLEHLETIQGFRTDSGEPFEGRKHDLDDPFADYQVLGLQESHAYVVYLQIRPLFEGMHELSERTADMVPTIASTATSQPTLASVFAPLKKGGSRLRPEQEKDASTHASESDTTLTPKRSGSQREFGKLRRGARLVKLELTELVSDFAEAKGGIHDTQAVQAQQAFVHLKEILEDESGSIVGAVIQLRKAGKEIDILLSQSAHMKEAMQVRIKSIRETVKTLEDQAEFLVRFPDLPAVSSPEASKRKPQSPQRSMLMSGHVIPKQSRKTVKATPELKRTDGTKQMPRKLKRGATISGTGLPGSPKRTVHASSIANSALSMLGASVTPSMAAFVGAPATAFPAMRTTASSSAMATTTMATTIPVTTSATASVPATTATITPVNAAATSGVVSVNPSVLLIPSSNVVQSVSTPAVAPSTSLTAHPSSVLIVKKRVRLHARASSSTILPSIVSGQSGTRVERADSRED